MNDLFEQAAERAAKSARPLAERMRPVSLDEFLGQDRLMAFVDNIANRLSYQVRADRMALQVVAIQQLALVSAVVRVGDRLVHLEVITPTSQLKPLIAKLTRLPRHVFQRQIGPVAGVRCRSAAVGRNQRVQGSGFRTLRTRQCRKPEP